MLIQTEIDNRYENWRYFDVYVDGYKMASIHLQLNNMDYSIVDHNMFPITYNIFANMLGYECNWKPIYGDILNRADEFMLGRLK